MGIDKTINCVLETLKKGWGSREVVILLMILPYWVILDFRFERNGL